jgi:hypothetical protein
LRTVKIPKLYCYKRGPSSLAHCGLTQVRIIRSFFSPLYSAVTMPCLIESKNFWDHKHVFVM